jgi:aminoglycoside phosphotransferase (APT) family kinase protein
VLDGLADLDLSSRGIPSESQFVARYAEQRGVDPSKFQHHYFLSFAFYRLASILQGVYRRAVDGNAASPYAFARGRTAELCLEKAVAFSAKG